MKKISLLLILLGCIFVASAQKETKVINLNKSDFFSKVYNYEKNPTQWIYEGNLPCIIDFYADWCRPCKMTAPILEEIAQEYQGKIIVYKIDTDKERELARTFGIESIPTILFVPMEGSPQAIKGAIPKETFERAINQVLLK